MLKAAKAMAAAFGLVTATVRGKRFGDIARHAAGVRRLSMHEAIPSLMNASARAEMASLWVGGTSALCRIPAQYAATGARFGGYVRFNTAPMVPAHAGRASAGARALWERLHAAGFTVAEEGAAVAEVSQADRAGAAVVRVLKETPVRARRSTWDQQGARRAA
jgi:hypothetical protein